MTDSSTRAEHCRHEKCCQCGAVSGAPEHAAECPDVLIRRAMARRNAGHVSRKLVRP